MYKRILVPIDGSPTAAWGLNEAIRLAKATGGQLIVLHLIDDHSLSLALESPLLLDRGWQEAIVEVGKGLLREATTTASRAGLCAASVLDEAWAEPLADRIVGHAARLHCDLIVMGSHGRRGVRRLLLGSAAETVARQTNIPLLLVHPAAGGRGDDGESAKARARCNARNTSRAPRFSLSE